MKRLFILGLSFLFSSVMLHGSQFHITSHSFSKSSAHDLAIKDHRPIESYDTARVILIQKIHAEMDETGLYVKDVYCGKIVRDNIGTNRLPSSNVMNTEHTWPQSKFNKEANVKYQKSDLHHLFPSDSHANTIRGNFSFSELSESEPISESCPDSYRGVANGAMAFEPPEHHKGNVARALFYFSVRYDIAISENEENVLRKWHGLDPVDEDELERNKKIATFQGNLNPFITNPELVDLIDNF